ncbi:MAG: hypothetical protein RLZZ507_1576 [Cyanobacteriota bacterium]|jgi:hypothetical protein
MSEEQNTSQNIIGTLIPYFQPHNFVEEEHNIDPEEESYEQEYIAQLQTACNNYLKKDFFQVGQLVKWKETLKNRKIPYKNQPAIVVEILDEPIIINEEETGSPYFREKLDIILGILVDNNTFLTFYYDSRRFKAY